MKQIIKSISDVITNSSSEVFVLNKEDAKYFALRSFDNDTNDCIMVRKIDNEWLCNEGRYERDIIRKLTGLNDSILSEDTLIPEENEWMDFVCLNDELLQDKVIGKYYIEIEDHYDGCEVDISKAKYESVYYDSRH